MSSENGNLDDLNDLNDLDDLGDLNDVNRPGGLRVVAVLYPWYIVTAPIY